MSTIGCEVYVRFNQFTFKKKNFQIIYIYICVCVYIYVYVYICICICICIYIYVYTHIHLQGPAEARLAGVWLGGYVNASHEMDSNLNISPKMSCDVLECDIVRELHVYDSVINDFVIKRGIICARPCVCVCVCVCVYITLASYLLLHEDIIGKVIGICSISKPSSVIRRNRPRSLTFFLINSTGISEELVNFDV